MIKKILEIYKRKLFNRCDDNGAIFYFSHTDYRDLNAEDYEFTSSKGYKLKGKFYFYDKHKHNHIIIFEHGMGGKNRGGDDGGLYAHGGNNGQGNGERTLAHAGDVLNCDDSFHLEKPPFL